MIIHRTKYKNVITTFLIAFIIGIVFYAILHLIFKFDAFDALTIAVLIAVILFYLIGKRIIVKHEINENLSVRIDFLLNPSKTVFLDQQIIERIVLKTIDLKRYGKLEKAYIQLKENKNYHVYYITLKFEDELYTFWTNFQYPNQLKKSS